MKKKTQLTFQRRAITLFVLLCSCRVSNADCTAIEKSSLDIDFQKGDTHWTMVFGINPSSENFTLNVEIRGSNSSPIRTDLKIHASKLTLTGINGDNITDLTIPEKEWTEIEVRIYEDEQVLELSSGNITTEKLHFSLKPPYEASLCSEFAQINAEEYGVIGTQTDGDQESGPTGPSSQTDLILTTGSPDNQEGTSDAVTYTCITVTVLIIILLIIMLIRWKKKRQALELPLRPVGHQKMHGEATEYNGLPVHRKLVTLLSVGWHRNDSRDQESTCETLTTPTTSAGEGPQLHPQQQEQPPTSSLPCL